jgi:ketosteroid isomerase-like protein
LASEDVVALEGEEKSMGATTRGLAAGAALLLVFGLGGSTAAPTRSQAERGVRLALIRLNKLLADRDLAILDEFSPSPDTLLVGGGGERCRGRAELEAFYKMVFSMPWTATYSWREVEVSARGDVAWVHAEGEVVMKAADGQETRHPYRLAGVLEPHGRRWQWRFFQGTSPSTLSS